MNVNTLKGEQIVRVLSIFEVADLYDGALIWKVFPDGIHFWAQCSDVFYWGTADGEPIETDADLDLLRQCLDELALFDSTFYMPELYAARRRKMRPQRPWLEHREDPNVLALFLAAGPERDPKDEG